MGESEVYELLCGFEAKARVGSGDDCDFVGEVGVFASSREVDYDFELVVPEYFAESLGKRGHVLRGNHLEFGNEFVEAND